MRCKNCGNKVPDESVFCNICGEKLFKPRRTGVTVPNASLLPSGKWRVQLRKEHINVIADTREQAEAEAIRRRILFLREEKRKAQEEIDKPLMLGTILDKYINENELVLSPTTVRSYKSMRKSRFTAYESQNANTINYQQLINSQIADECSAKTIRNVWGLCSAALNYSNIPFAVPNLPRIVREEHEWLDYSQILKFVKAIKGEKGELAFLLALHSLRASEFLGLRPCDIEKIDKHHVIHVRGANIRGTQGRVRTSRNKNDTSRRNIPVVIPRLDELLNDADANEQYLVTRSETRLRADIERICKANGLPNVGLHGLRHSFASLAYHLGWKKRSTMEIGGWKNSKVLDAVYEHNADLDDDIETMRDFFGVSKS